MSDQKIIVPIKGMHCKSCEILLEDEFSKIAGVASCKADFKKRRIELIGSPSFSQFDLDKAAKLAGYSIGETVVQPFFKITEYDIKDLSVAFLFLLAAYYIFQVLGLGNFSINATSGISMPIAVLVGLTAGFSTCMALVGGLVLGVATKHNEAHPEASAMEKFRPHLTFNFGRIVIFGILGGVLGAMGSTLKISPSVTGGLIILAGAVMLLMGLQLLEIFPRLNNFKITLPKSIARILGIEKHQKEYNHRGAFIMGGLTFFLPCGFTQTMQIYALSSGSFMGGAMIMMVFALGTAPGLLSIGGLASSIGRSISKKFFKFAGLTLIFMALFNINNASTLLGFGFAPASNTNQKANTQNVNANDPNVQLVNNVQTVKMVESNRGYSPNSFTIKKGVPVRWVIDAQAPYSCASSIVIPKLNVSEQLKPGENVIEFTATEAGALRFSCSMGMYTGAFNVIN